MQAEGIENYARFLLRNVDMVPVNLRTVVGTLAEHRKARIKMARVQMHPAVGGLAVFEAGTYVLGVNSRHNHTRRRTTLAHEIAEVALGQLRKTTVYQLIRQRDTKREARAFRLARAILVPDWFALPAIEADHDNLAGTAKYIADQCRVSLDVACLRIRDFHPDFGFKLYCGNELIFSYGNFNSGDKSAHQIVSFVKMGNYTLVGTRKVLPTNLWPKTKNHPAKPGY